MNDIAELERRITLALERIGAGIDLIGAAAPAPAGDAPCAAQAAAQPERPQWARLA